MNSRSITSLLGLALAGILGTAALADEAPTPKNPETNASDKNFDKNQPNSVPGGWEKSKDGANRSLNKLDRGVHKVTHGTKKGAHKAKSETNETLNELSEPAKKPS